jgi:hypothetical protein
LALPPTTQPNKSQPRWLLFDPDDIQVTTPKQLSTNLFQNHCIQSCSKPPSVDAIMALDRRGEHLREAACSGDWETVTSLLQSGLNPNDQNKVNGW